MYGWTICLFYRALFTLFVADAIENIDDNDYYDLLLLLLLVVVSLLLLPAASGFGGGSVVVQVLGVGRDGAPPAAYCGACSHLRRVSAAGGFGRSHGYGFRLSATLLAAKVDEKPGKSAIDRN